MLNYFPKDFVWGAAASAFQIEGAAFEGGKGANKHDHILRDPELKHHYDGTRLPDVCADFYHLYPEDIKLFKELGLKSFRYSISWARIYPNGPEGGVNEEGIAFYNRLIDALLAAGIEPFMDLYHSDVPWWVIERGGMLNREFVEWFSVYAETCFKAFGDRVKLWSTVNEPKLQVYGAYAFAFSPPYMKDERAAMIATHHMLLAHFEAVKHARRICPDAKVGSVHNMGKTYPATNGEKDVYSAEMHDILQHVYLYPMVYGVYPETLLQNEEFFRYVTEEEKAELRAAFVPCDFAGVNYYTPCYSKYDPTQPYGIGAAECDRGFVADGYGFRCYPQGLFDTLWFCGQLYPDLDLFITENGYTTLRGGEFDEPTTAEDPERINYIREHILETWRAIQAGSRVKGYYHWAAMDCFEGGLGFGVDMGLIGINYGTLERVPRKSFYFYQEVIKHHGLL